MKKIFRRVGAVFLVLATLFLLADVSFFYGANVGFDQGYWRGMVHMYNELTLKA
jgi:hypothetical protein